MSLVTPATRAQMSAKKTKANRSDGTLPCGRANAKCPKTPWGVAMERLEQVKARIRAKGEHAFHRSSTSEPPKAGFFGCAVYMDQGLACVFREARVMATM